MDPNQQQPPQYPVGGQQQPGVPNQFTPQQYDFIMGDQPKPKKPLIPMPSGGSSKTQRLIFVGIGVLVLLIIVIVFASLLSSKSKSGTENLVTVAAQQTEIVRVAKLGTTKAGSSAAKNLALTTQLTVNSQKNGVVKYLLSNKRKVNNKELSATKDIKTDTSLANAETNGRFDDTFVQIIRDLLAKYQASLKTAYSASGPKGKALLDQDYKDVSVLLESANAAQ